MKTFDPTVLLECFPQIKERSKLKWVGEVERENIEKLKIKTKEVLEEKYPGLWNKLKDFQKEDIAIALSKGKEMRILLAHDMGLGKTIISAVTTAAHALLYKKRANILVIAPVTSGQYVNFAAELKKWGFKTVALEGPLDVMRYLKDPAWWENKEPTFFIISESKAKLTTGMRKVLVSAAGVTENRLKKALAKEKAKLSQLNITPEDSPEKVEKQRKILEKIRYLTIRLEKNRCPVCGRPIEKLSGNKPVCPHCKRELEKRKRGEKGRISTSYITLWSAYRRYTTNRWPIHKLVKRYGKGFFQYLIVDEAHEEKKEDSSRGTVVSALSNYIPNVLYLTGTPFQGKSSQLFYILGRLFRWDKRKFPFSHKNLAGFIHRYGVKLIKIKDRFEDGKYNSWRSETKKYVREAPGIGNKMLWVLFNQVMIRRRKEHELKGVLKKMEEYSIKIPLSEEHLPIYRASLIEAEALKKQKPPNYSAAYWLLMSTVNIPESAGAKEQINRWLITNKDKALLNLLRKLIVREKRKVLIFTGLTDRIPVMEKLYRLVSKAGYKTELWPASIPNSERPAIVERFTKNSSHAAIASLGAYNEGLNIIGASTVVFYEPYPRPEFYKQAKDRIWRIGQKRDTKAYLLYTKGTIEEHTWDILITKIDAMEKFVNGELPPATLVEMVEQLNKEVIKEAVEKTFEDLTLEKEIETGEVVLEVEDAIANKEKIQKPAPEEVVDLKNGTFYQPSLF